MNLKNKNIIITGATSGIGRALAIKLLQNGANIAICGKSKEKMTSLISELKQPKNNIFYDTFDITESKSISTFIEESIKNLGEIDILVNCAGVNSARSLVSQIDIADLEWMLKVNLLAPFLFMQDVYNKSMKKKNGGQIINVLSTVCQFSNEGIGAYTASKSAFDALLKVFRKEVRENNIRVCSIYPGGVDTPFREAARPQYLDPKSVAQAIIAMMEFDEKTSVDELVIRPICEKNFS